MGQRVLKLCSGRGAGQRFRIDGQGKVIGRATSADISLEDNQAAELHAMVVHKDSRVMLYDLGSESGTYVNERKIEETEVFPGDTIQIGSSLLELIDDEPSASLGPTPGATGNPGPSGPRQGTGPLRTGPLGTGGLGTGGLGTGGLGTGGLGTGGLGNAGLGTGALGTAGLGTGNVHTGGLGTGGLGTGGLGVGLGGGFRGNDAAAGQGLPNPTGSINLQSGYGTGNPGRGGAPDLSLPALPPSNALMTQGQVNALTELQARMLMGQFLNLTGGAHTSNLPQGHGAGVPQHGGGAPPLYTHPMGHAAATPDDEPNLIAQLVAFYGSYRPYILTVAGFVFAGLLAGAVSLALKPPPQSATFAVALTQTAQDNPLRPYAQNGLEFFRSAMQAFRSPALIEKTLVALGETELGPSRVERVQTQLGIESVGRLGATITYSGTFKGDTSEDSLRLLGAHVQLFLDSEINKTLRVISVQREFLQRQLVQTEKELRRTERELLEFKKKNIDSLPEQARQNYDLLFQLQQRLSQSEVDVSRAVVAKRTDQLRLSAEAPLVENRVTSSRSYRTQIIEANARLASLRAEGKGEDHPDVVTYKAQIAQLEQLDAQSRKSNDIEVEQRRNPQYSAIQDSLRLNEVAVAGAGLQAEQTRRELERVRGIVERLPELETQYAELTRSYGVSKELHGKIFGQLKSTQLQFDLERAAASARYDLFQPPTLEAPPLVKTLVVRALIGAIVGALFGGIASLIMYRRRAKKSAQQPKPGYTPPGTVDVTGVESSALTTPERMGVTYRG